MVQVGILTVSDLGSRGEREDTAGPALQRMVEGMGWSVVRYEIVPDELAEISGRLQEWADEAGLQLILTTGGTGFSDRDVTPRGHASGAAQAGAGTLRNHEGCGADQDPHGDAFAGRLRIAGVEP